MPVTFYIYMYNWIYLLNRVTIVPSAVALSSSDHLAMFKNTFFQESQGRAVSPNF